LTAPDRFRLDGRVALVTGGARGIGQALALGLAEAGADLALLDRSPCEETGKEVADLGRKHTEIEADLGSLNPSDADAIIQTAVERLGRLDILVNAAGIIRRSPATDIQPEDWQTVLDVDLSAAFYLSQSAARQFIAAGTGGKIISIASMLSFQGGVLTASYAAAKSGLAGLTRALANEWAPLGINVNAIAPGYFSTPLTEALRQDPERSSQILARIPAGRWGEAADLKGAVVFLASEAAAYVHGVILPVDGGWLSR
jgi:2-deoxy-D-gluconate 3-dehydrogenase